jgi:putative cell wall-binding protein
VRSGRALVSVVAVMAAAGVALAGSGSADGALCAAAPPPTTTTSQSPTTSTTAPASTTTTRATTTTRPTTTTTAAVSTARLAGADRFATAAAVSAATFAPEAPVAYVASGESWPDALAAAPVAAAEGGPVLLVTRDAIPEATVAELDRLRPRRIVVLGGPAVVSDAVVGRLWIFTTGTVTRIAGPDRFSTAAAVSASRFAPGVPEVFLATGLDFPDALAAGPAAGCVGGPILLMAPTAIPEATAAELDRLDPGHIVLLGNPSAVSAQLERPLAAYARDGLTRVAGPDRYATAAALSAYAFSGPAAQVLVATGTAPWDALAAGAAGGAARAPLLLVPGAVPVPQVVKDDVRRLQPGRLTVLGGPKAVPDAVVGDLKKP